MFNIYSLNQVRDSERMAHPRQKNLAIQGFSVYILKIFAKKFVSPSEGAAEERGEGEEFRRARAKIVKSRRRDFL